MEVLCGGGNVRKDIPAFDKCSAQMQEFLRLVNARWWNLM